MEASTGIVDAPKVFPTTFPWLSYAATANTYFWFGSSPSTFSTHSPGTAGTWEHSFTLCHWNSPSPNERRNHLYQTSGSWQAAVSEADFPVHSLSDTAKELVPTHLGNEMYQCILILTYIILKQSLYFHLALVYMPYTRNIGKI